MISNLEISNLEKLNCCFMYFFGNSGAMHFCLIFTQIVFLHICLLLFPKCTLKGIFDNTPSLHHKEFFPLSPFAFSL